jgi:UDP-2,4-diacetamido-2,4,6-trideoxy-beta-L-altropyranose hydrolase
MMRTLALAQMCTLGGGNAVFLSYCRVDWLRKTIEESGISYLSLDRSHPDPADLQRTLETLNKMDRSRNHEVPVWLVADGYHLDAAYQRAVRDAGRALLVIDDTACEPHYYAHLLLNQNLNAAELAYSCEPDTQLLLGTRYALIRPEFLNWATWRRRIGDKAENILVTLGGSDPWNVTSKVLRALRLLGRQSLRVKVVVGPANEHSCESQDLAEKHGFNFELVQATRQMPELMAWADLAISAAGSTCWELALMKVPSIVLAVADNQLGIANALGNAEAAMNLGRPTDVSEAEIAAAVHALIEEADLRRQVSARISRLVDGKGTMRLLDSILSYRLKGTTR